MSHRHSLDGDVRRSVVFSEADGSLAGSTVAVLSGGAVPASLDARVFQQHGQQLHRHGQDPEAKGKQREATDHNEGAKAQPSGQTQQRTRLGGAHRAVRRGRLGDERRSHVHYRALSSCGFTP